MTPEKIAYSISRGNAAEAAWSNLGAFALYPYSYTDSLSVDKSGLYNDVEYTNSLSEAVKECAKGGEIYISENKDDKEKVIYLDDAKDNITITAAPEVKNIYVAQNKNKDDILNQFNKLGGTIYGLIEGLFIIFVIFAILSLISPLINS